MSKNLFNTRKTKRKGMRNFNSPTPRHNMIEDLTLKEMFQRFMNYKKTESLTRTTINDYHIHFGYLIDYLEGDLYREEITLEVFRGYIGHMLHDKGLSPVTANVRIRTMRAFIRYCFLEGYIDEPIHDRFKPVKTQEDTLESFSPTEVKQLMSVIDELTYVGFRDKVMMLVMLDTMVRASELLSMRRTNVDLKAGEIKLEPHETKTKRARIVPLSLKSIKLLEEYLVETEDFGEETLFLTYDGRPIAGNTWRKRLMELGDLAGIINKRVSPHTFRHTGALFYILNGGDPFSLQKILGHTDMSMVRKYIQMTNTDVKKQHNQFSPIKFI
jgi:integrase/recombinase XerD